MPKGVEHILTILTRIAGLHAQPSLMPKGVEHLIEAEGYRYMVSAALFDAERR